MKKTLIALAVIGLTVSFSTSCKKGSDDSASIANNTSTTNTVNYNDAGRYGVPEFSEEYLNSIDPLSPEEYESNLSILRPDLKEAFVPLNYKISAVSSTLPTPPVGDQGTEGSCVGWGIGYCAHSITRYINNSCEQSNWGLASRSAAYIYNQIKISDCGSGSYPNDAMNLIKSQGECSNAQMPYVDGGCSTQPNSQQKLWASQRKSSGWFNINAKSVTDIKYYLNNKYPVAACFNVNSSFLDIKYNNYIWNSLYGSRIGGHCVCIVGYDDNTQSFKVQNSWGPSWGRSGYFYVTYNNIKRGAFNWMGCIVPNPQANTPQ